VRPVSLYALPATPTQADPNQVFSVTTKDGGTLKLNSVWLEDEILNGRLADGGGAEAGEDRKVEIPWEEIRTIEKTELDLQKTLRWSAVGLGIYALAGFLLIAAVFAGWK
jgi:hypothetical protein